MPKKTFTPEQIVGKLRQIEVLVSQGKTVPVACREAGIVEQTFYRWRKEYGGLQLEQAKKLGSSGFLVGIMAPGPGARNGSRSRSGSSACFGNPAPCTSPIGSLS